MTLYRISMNMNNPGTWYVDTRGNNPQWLVAALNTMTDAIAYSEWKQDDNGAWWLHIDWRPPYTEDIYPRLNAALLAVLDQEIQLHGVA